MASTKKQSLWQNHINAWRESGGSQKAYCQAHNLSLASFGYWKRRLVPAQPAAGKLIPVRVNSPSAVILVRLPWGVELSVPVSALEDVLPVISRAASESA